MYLSCFTELFMLLDTSLQTEQRCLITRDDHLELFGNPSILKVAAAGYRLCFGHINEAVR